MAVNAATTPFGEGVHERARRWVGLGLFFASGASGLLYEVVWTRLLALHFGATPAYLAAVLSAFMVGLALGSWLAARWAHRIRSPLALYGLLELGVAATAQLVPTVISAFDPLLQPLYPGASGPSAGFQLLRFAVAFAALVPTTLLMGATLPVLSQGLSLDRDEAALQGGRAYALNTLGAMLGAYLAGFVLIRTLGMHRTGELAVELNLGIGAIALVLAGWVGASTEAVPLAPPAPGTSPASTAPGEVAAARGVVMLCGYSGFASLAYEVFWTRFFINTFYSTVLAFSTILIAYLAGLGVGALVASSIARRWPVRFGHLVLLQLAIAASAILLVGSLVALPHLYIALLNHGQLAFRQELRALLVGAMMFPPALLMGMSLPLGVHLVRKENEAVAAQVGVVYAAASWGSAAGPLVATFILMPRFGLASSIVVVAAVQAVVAGAALVLRRSEPPGLRRLGLAAAAATLLLAVGREAQGRTEILPLNVIAPHDVEGAPEEVRFYRESQYGTMVVADSSRDGERTLYIDGFAATSNGGKTRYMQLMGHLPMLLHARASSALVICLGTGTTLGSVGLHQPEQLDCVELNPDVASAAPLFAEQNHGVLGNPHTRLLIDDGRNYLQMTDRRYDVITLEPLPPMFSGTVSLYSREFNVAARSRLRPGGVLAQWLPYHLVTDLDARMIVRAVADVFTHVMVWRMPGEPSAIVLASDQPLVFSPEALAAHPEVQKELATLGLPDVAALERAILVPESRIGAYTASVAAVTDDFPALEYRDWASDYRQNANSPSGITFSAEENIALAREAAGLPPEPRAGRPEP